MIIGGAIKLTLVSGIIACLILSIWMVLAIVFEGIVRVIYHLFFRKKQKELDKERKNNIQFLKDMGIEVLTDAQTDKNYTSIR